MKSHALVEKTPKGLAKKFIHEYWTWNNMKGRCYDPKDGGYSRYGGKGIRVCKRWFRSFAKFLEDMGPRPSAKHSIDRIDYKGHYTPKNCRWATAIVQNRNSSHNVILTHNGESHCISEWAEIVGMEKDQLWNRINRGWPIAEALTRPIGAQPNLKRLTLNGETKSISEWSKITGLSYPLIRARLKQNLPIEEVLTTNKKSLSDAGKVGGKSRWKGINIRMLTHNGVTKTLSAWAIEVGHAYGTVLNRWKQGMTSDEILSPIRMSFSDAAKLAGKNKGKK